ncbi:MAG: dihydroorotase [Eggerthellaceae bacterium]|nr:dihydroorotase [Eggerthellaceae bacterium]
MSLLLKNVLAIDGQIDLHEVLDIRIKDDLIAEVGKGLSEDGCEVRDLSGCIATPGFVDIHVHLREPGYEYKEDIESGTRAAAHGGMVAVCSMPNTNPVTDSASVIEFILRRSREAGHCRVLPSGACTKGLKGEILAEMGDMARHGAVAFTDDGRGVQDASMMRRVMEYASQFDCPVMSHCQDESLVGAGQINEGKVSTLLGLAGWPAQGEEIQISRDIELCRLTGCQYHVQHVTTARGMELIRQAKANGLPVTCEVTPHHLFLDETDIDDSYNTFLKVNPPLRSKEDASALIDAVVDGTVDALVTDHAPHADFEKDLEFEEAPFGMTGIETSLALYITNLIKPGVITWERLVELLAINPRKILHQPPVMLKPGYPADITITDPDIVWTVTKEEFESKSCNSGFIGCELTGRARDVYVGGIATLLDGAVTELGKGVDA